jgi:hypothetical protein
MPAQQGCHRLLYLPGPWAAIITTDMGGTSFDVGLIVDGRPVISTTSVVEVSYPHPYDQYSCYWAGREHSRVEGHLSRTESAGRIPAPYATTREERSRR